MTVNRLSAQSVKVQLSADELKHFLAESASAADAPQMMRLISMMLSHAESVSGIPFSEYPVTVELFAAPQGGLTAYFTVQMPASRNDTPVQTKNVSTAAGFPDQKSLLSCCMQLSRHSSRILSSTLYRCRSRYILTLKLCRTGSGTVQHILLEYGLPFRLSPLNRARLSEFGTCLCEQDAVRAVCSGTAQITSPRSSRTASAGDAAPSR
ncbi:MAG: adaptor protein MecA [Oscillospiraceae bacterium]|nr:adaptor protein MecA [Oscillospiraceae bacterium]